MWTKAQCISDGYSPKKIQRPPESLRLFSKKTYSKGVKVSGWEYENDYQSTETEPYQLDYLTENKVKYTWKTSKKYVDPYKKMTNICSYRDDEEINIKPSAFCPEKCMTDFRTTMQLSYSPPYPYVMQRISMPKTPYFLNRHIDQPIQYSPLKFYDEENMKHVCRLRKYRGVRQISFIPWLGKYTDGSM